MSFVVALAFALPLGLSPAVADEVVFDVPATAKCYLLSQPPMGAGNADASPHEAANLAKKLDDQTKGQGGSQDLASLDAPAGQHRTRVTLAKVSHSSELNGLEVNRASAGISSSNEGSLSQRYGIDVVSQTRRYLIPIDVTVLFADTDRVESVMFEIIPQSHCWNIVDYAPQNQSMTNFEGPISLETKKDGSGGLIGDLKGGIPGYADLSLHIDGGKKENTLSRHQLKAPQTQVVTSGLSQRGSGAFFKLQSSREFVIEGGHRLELIFDAPATWRGDVLQVHCRAKTTDSMIVKDFLVATYVDGDIQAGASAQQMAHADRVATGLLNRLQVSYQKPSTVLGDLEDLFKRRPEKEDLQPSQIQRAMIWATDVQQIRGNEKFPAKIQDALAQMIQAKRVMLQYAR